MSEAREAVTEDWDVIVAGGGPAGSSAANILARAGKKVLVLEKEVFPRFHVGESMLTYSTALFEELGVADEIEQGDFMLKKGAQFRSADGSRVTYFVFGDGPMTEYPTTWQVERSRFDDILLRAAARFGATVREGVKVTDWKTGADGAEVEWTGPDGRGRGRAKVFMDATGQSNLTANRARLRTFHPKLKKVAVFAHFHHVAMEPPEDPCHGDIIIVRLAGGWSWLIPLSPEKTSVGFVVDAERYKQHSKPEELVEAMSAESAELRRRLGAAERVCDWVKIADYSYRNSRLAEPGLVRIGDAAGFLDPIFSSGVLLALTGGVAGAKAVLAALAEGRSEHPAFALYEKATRRNMKLFQAMIEGYYTPEMMEVMFHPEPNLKILSAVNAALAGRLDGNRRVSRGLWAFHRLCALQRWLPIAPRIPELRQG